MVIRPAATASAVINGAGGQAPQGASCRSSRALTVACSWPWRACAACGEWPLPQKTAPCACWPSVLGSQHDHAASRTHRAAVQAGVGQQANRWGQSCRRLRVCYACWGNTFAVVMHLAGGHPYTGLAMSSKKNGVPSRLTVRLNRRGSILSFRIQ